MTYREVFMGSASLFFHLAPKRAALADMNRALVDAFMEVKLDPTAVANDLASLGGGKDAYYAIRGVDPDELDTSARAARFIYLMQFCYGGIYRENRSGKFNVPYGGSGTGALPCQEDLARASKVLANADLHCSPYEAALLEAREGDFVYLDPPYSDRAHRHGQQFSYDSFGPQDLKQLVAELTVLDQRGVSFLLSYADCSEIRSLLPNGWRVTSQSTWRSIARHGAQRRRAIELLVSNY